MPGPIGNLHAATWRIEHIDMLRRHMAAGLTFSEVANELSTAFGITFTRNMCCGKASRLKLQSQNAPCRRPTEKTPAERRAEHAAAQRKRRVQAEKVIAMPPRPIPQFHRDTSDIGQALNRMRCAQVEPLNVRLTELADNGCRWPVTGWPEPGPTLFCGCPQVEGSSYCGPHAALATGPGTVSERAAHRTEKVV